MTVEKKKNKLGSYKRLLSYLWPYWKILLVSVVCMLFVAGSNLILPSGHCGDSRYFPDSRHNHIWTSLSYGVYGAAGYY